jgi:hypothetical protein
MRTAFDFSPTQLTVTRLQALLWMPPLLLSAKANHARCLVTSLPAA